MEKYVEYTIDAIKGDEVHLTYEVETSYVSYGRYGRWVRTRHYTTEMVVRISRLEWLAARALEGRRVRISPSEKGAITALLELGYEFRVDPEYLIIMTENDWDL